MTEDTDLISKKAAYTALEAAIRMHVLRAEELAAEAQKLQAEIEDYVPLETEARV